MFDRSAAVLPAGLEGMEPSPVLAAFLSTVTDESVSGHDRIRVLKAHQRLVSFFQAQVFEDMASISQLMDQLEADPEIAHEAAAAEIGAALQLTRRAAESDLGLALDLKERLPVVWEALASGRIDLRRALVIVKETAHLSVDAAREVVRRVIEPATRLTTGQLGALIRRFCVQADPDDANSRYREAVDRRRLEMQPSVDSTAHLFGLDLPPDRAEAAMRRIADLARGLKTADETRTLDQIRADVFLDLLDVDLTTLARLLGFLSPRLRGDKPNNSSTATTDGPADSATPTPPADSLRETGCVRQLPSRAQQSGRSSHGRQDTSLDRSRRR